MSTAHQAHPGRVTHFRVPAIEMVLDEPHACPVYPLLTFTGVAIDIEDRQHLILETPAARAYFGPSTAVVHTRTSILTAALTAGGASSHSDAIATWVHDCWRALLDELVAAASFDLSQLS